MSIDRAHLVELALELVEDVQAVYIAVAADELTERGHNQAFFKKLYVMSEWDGGETVTWISGVELTEPYALLLTEGLFERAEAEARAIGAGTPTQNRAGSAVEHFRSPVSIDEHMAGVEGRRSNTGGALASCTPSVSVKPTDQAL
jgi:hypothetical protein